MIKNIRKLTISLLVVWLIIGGIDFVLVHNYQKPIFSKGQDTADDGGSGRYVGLGYSFLLEGGLVIDENPQFQIKYFESYIFNIKVSEGTRE